MLKYYFKTTEALKRLSADKDGVVSFEYVIVAACIVAAVAAAFGTTTATGIGAVLKTASISISIANRQNAEDRLALSDEGMTIANAGPRGDALDHYGATDDHVATHDHYTSGAGCGSR